MTCVEQICMAEEKGLIEKSILRKIEVTPIKECLDGRELESVERLSVKFKCNQCLDNAGLVMRELGTVCCEGLAFIIPDMEQNIYNEGVWIIHCWNKKGDKYFDVTEEYIYRETTPSPREIHYFLLQECSPSDYIDKINRGEESGFVSNAVKIEKVLKKMNGEKVPEIHS